MAEKKSNRVFRAFAVIVVVAAAVIAVCAVAFKGNDIMDFFFSETTTEVVTTEATTAEPETTLPYITNTVTIGSAGDVLIHIPIFKAAKAAEGYNFDNIFTYTSSVIKDCDYFIANLETTLAGPSRPYSGFPRFNSPDAIVSALKKAGVDGLLTANNHSYDTNNAGVLRTQEVIKKEKLDYVGTRLKADGRKHLVKNIGGIGFGFMCYTYETPSSGGLKSLNAIPVDSETAPLINSFNYEKLPEFYDEVKAQMKAMKKKGAEVFTIYMHWGEEYQLSENAKQKEIAQTLCNLGVDVIIGGHPHVVEPVDLLTSENGKHKTVCVYSVGNLLSNQRRAYMGLKTGHTEDGLIFTMTFSKYSDGRVVFDSVKSIPTWVHLYSEGGRTVYNVVPLSGNLEKNAEKLGLNRSSNGLALAKESYKRTMALVKEGTDKCNAYLKSKEVII